MRPQSEEDVDAAVRIDLPEASGKLSPAGQERVLNQEPLCHSKGRRGQSNGGLPRLHRDCSWTSCKGP